MEDLGARVDEVMSNLVEQVGALNAEVAQKSAKIDQLTKVIAGLESDLAKLTPLFFEQQRELYSLRLRFDSIRAAQAALIELLETKLSFSRRINDKLCDLITNTYRSHQENNDRSLEEVERLKEEVASRENYKESMEKLLSENLHQSDQGISRLLERYATEVRDAHREKCLFETMLRKFKNDDHRSREGFNRLCRELIQEQQRLIESELPPPRNSPP